MVMRVVTTTGLFFMIAGITAIIKPELATTYLGFDPELTQWMGGALIIVGCFDAFIVPRLVAKSLSKAEK